MSGKNCQDHDIGLKILRGSIWWCNSCKVRLDKASMLDHIMLDSHSEAVARHTKIAKEGGLFGGPFEPTANPGSYFTSR
jgi:hypothetical protein